jgi:hypothetical protein
MASICGSFIEKELAIWQVSDMAGPPIFLLTQMGDFDTLASSFSYS